MSDPYLAAIQALVENDSHRPDIHLVGDFGRFLSDHKALRRQIPDGGETRSCVKIYPFQQMKLSRSLFFPLS